VLCVDVPVLCEIMNKNKNKIYIFVITLIFNFSLLSLFADSSNGLASDTEVGVFATASSLNPSVYIALGCGVTSGSSPVTYDPWPERLDEMILGVSVVNLGDSRTYSSDGAERINWQMQTYAPQYVLVLYGLNDIKPGIPNSVIIDNLKTIVRTAQYYGADVVLGTLPRVPIFSIYEKWVVDQLNKDIKSLAAQYGAEVADIASVMGDDSSLYLDGLHPTRTGYIMIAEAFKAEVFSTTLSGDGTVGNPYVISDMTDFYEFCSNEQLVSGNYRLDTDINLGGQLYSHAIVDRAFGGNFYGQEHVISNFVIQGNNDYVGVFRLLDGGIIDSLDVSAFSISGNFYAGGLCGRNDIGTIRNCNTDGNVTGQQYVGGLLGLSYYGLIEECSARGNVTGVDYTGGFCGRSYRGHVKNNISDSIVSGNDFTGGLLGSNYEGTLEECYSIGTTTGNLYVGGLCGHNHDGFISNAYSRVSVSGVDYAGGFCGRSYYGTVQNCYSIGEVSGGELSGGFTGTNQSPVITSCFWNVSTSGMTNSASGTGKITAEMKDISTFTDAGWDFTNIWCLVDYPELRSLALPFEIWLSDSGAPADLRNWNDDPAGDGIESIWKYASGLDLLTPSSITNVYSYTTESNLFTVLYYKSKRTDAVIIPEWKTSLMDNDWKTANGMINSKVSETSEREKWKAAIPMESNGFIRVRAVIEVSE